jgi:Icc-related predicted phosphoesterase
MNELKIWVWSDLHQEVDRWEFPARLPRADVAVVAGDLHRLPDAIDWLVRRLDAGILPVQRVVLVPGNHDYYRREMTDALRRARMVARDLGIDLLDMDEVVIGGVRFLGGTLWTDYAVLGDAEAGMAACRENLANDYSLIGIADAGGVRRFSPERALDLHRSYVAWLERSLAVPFVGPTVVVTHHGPTLASTDPRRQNEAFTAGFASDLAALIDRFQPDLWIHGHTHVTCDYRVGRTRVLCNPKGYGLNGDEENRGFDPRLVVKIETGAKV